MLRMTYVVQVAGVCSVDEGLMLAACGATHVGLPLRLAVHRPDVSEEQARDIVRALSGRAETVLITYLADALETLALCRYLGVSGVQLHGDMPLGQVRLLRQAAPDLFVIKSLVVGAAPEADIFARAQDHAPLVDAFLTDTYDPASGATGATGKAHDWKVSERLAQRLPRPLILAGGLNPDNVAQAIQAVRPAGVDAHTGLEDAQGRKDEALVRRFVAEARRAFDSMPAAGLAKDIESK
ncbi:MAG: phosphoribosylanthranilate isomerase [Humidesulfovibrio sp.]|nr:phosphoribosylanthranilate isomerase [Humidesulfovibrio sp.]